MVKEGNIYGFLFRLCGTHSLSSAYVSQELVWQRTDGDGRRAQVVGCSEFERLCSAVPADETASAAALASGVLICCLGSELSFGSGLSSCYVIAVSFI